MNPSANFVDRAREHVRTAPSEVRLLYGVSLVLFANAVVHFIALAVTGQSWEGPVSLRKPATFSLGFGMACATVGWIGSHLPELGRDRRVRFAIIGWIPLVETLIVDIQAWRGVRSHFHQESLSGFVAYCLMGAGITVFAVALGRITLWTVRLPLRATPLLSTGLRAGMLSLFLGTLVGYVMILNGGTTLPTGGDLKVVHAVWLHGGQLFPAMALVLERLHASPHVRRWAFTIGLVGYSSLMAATLGRALAPTQANAPLPTQALAGRAP